VPKFVAAAKGTVLEAGPGIGNQLGRFKMEKITHIYGVESNANFEVDIKKRIEEFGLGDKYQFVPCGIEDSDILEKYGITANSMDTILCLQVLCSVSDPAIAAKELYRLLKPGGRFIFWEHHQSHDRLTRFVQSKRRIAILYISCHLLLPDSHPPLCHGHGLRSPHSSRRCIANCYCS
jgi:SAM-dependent methyltransferase